MMLVCYLFKLCKCIIVNKFRAGVQLTRYSKGPSDNIVLGALLDPRTAVVKIEENLEQLLAPTSRSIFFKLTFGSTNSVKKLKPVVLETLTRFVSVFHIFT